MKKSTIPLTLGLALTLGAISAAAEPPPAAREAPSRGTEASADINLLKGTWVRPDGGYTIVISKVDASGQLEAMYFNPRQLPFAKAEVSREGTRLRAFFELRAGGYDGSTYDLSYDPVSDRLTGVYYQAVAKQHFNVFFLRKH